MPKKLDKSDLKKKRDFHKKRVKFYDRKIEAAEKESKRIGFKWYD